MDSLIVYLNDIPAVAERLSARFPSPCYGRIVDGILRRCGQLED